MLLTTKYYRDFIELLNKHKVQYILVGGVAVFSHGYERSTGDVDLWINPASENMKKVIEAIRDFGFDTSSIEDHEFTPADSPIKLVQGDNKIDIIHHLTNVISFEEAWKKVTKEERDNFHFYLINYYHLEQIKLAAGRLKDLADVDEMRKLREIQNGEKAKPLFWPALKSLFKNIFNKK